MGAKSFGVRVPEQGHPQGRVADPRPLPDVPLTKAREIANDARKAVANGEVPVAAKVRHVQAERAAMTYAKVVELYYDAHLATLRTGHATRTTLQRVGRVYGWKRAPIVSITDDEAAIVLSDLADRRGKKATAKQTKHLLHAMFKWAKQPGPEVRDRQPFFRSARAGRARSCRATGS
jgi:hypothetical protein